MVDFLFPIYEDAHTRWMSKGPGVIPPASNLINTLDPASWAFTFASLVSVTVALLIIVRVGKSYGMPQPDIVEILLEPFAMLIQKDMPNWFNVKR